MKLFDQKSSQEKISDKAFSHGLLISALSIFICLVALCSATYAWFGDTKASDHNTLISGSFDLMISVASQNADLTETVVDPEPNSADVGVTSYRLTEGEYTVTLTLSPEATVKGHCVIEIGGKALHTAAIVGDSTANRDGYAINSPYTFTLTVTEDTEVSFKPVWGVAVYSDILADNSYAASSWASYDSSLSDGSN